MATWRRLILTGLLLAVLSLLTTVGHGPGPDDGEPTVAAVQQDHHGACSIGPSCAPFIIVAAAEATRATQAASSADLWALAKLWHRSPHLSDDPPPPRSIA